MVATVALVALAFRGHKHTQQLWANFQKKGKKSALSFFSQSVPFPVDRLLPYSPWEKPWKIIQTCKKAALVLFIKPEGEKNQPGSLCILSFDFLQLTVLRLFAIKALFVNILTAVGKVSLLFPPRLIDQIQTKSNQNLHLQLKWKPLGLVNPHALFLLLFLSLSVRGSHKKGAEGPSWLAVLSKW